MISFIIIIILYRKSINWQFNLGISLIIKERICYELVGGFLMKLERPPVQRAALNADMKKLI